MAYLLRIIKKGRWICPEEAEWIGTDDLHADPLRDLNTDNNKLSVWHIENDLSNLDRVVAAISAKRDGISNFDYILIPSNALDEIKLNIVATKGNVHDKLVAEEWHRDLIEISVNKIASLAKYIGKNLDKKRIHESRIKILIAVSVKENNINSQSINPKILEDISS